MAEPNADIDQAYVEPETRRNACHLVELALLDASVRQQTCAIFGLRNPHVKLVDLRSGRRYTTAERKLAARMLAYNLRGGAANDGA